MRYSYNCYIQRIFFLTILSVIFFISTKAQNCESNLFGKNFNFDGSGYGPYADTIPGGGFILGCVRNSKKALIKSDVNGNFLWAKSYDFTEATIYSENGSGKVDNNGNYVIDINGTALALINPQGDVLAMKNFQIPNANVVIQGIYVLPDNKKLVFLDDQAFYGGDAYALVCLSPDLSNVVWTKYMSGSYLTLFPPSLMDNKLYIGGRGDYGDYGLFICIDALTGNVIRQAKYKVANIGTSLLRIYKTENGYLTTAVYNPPSGQYKHVVIRLDENLNVVNAYGLSEVFNGGMSLNLLAEEGGGFTGTSSYGGYRFNISPADEITWSRYTLAGYLTAPFEFFRYRGGLVSISHGNWNNVGVGNESSLAIVKTDENGMFPCFLSTITRTKQIVTVDKSPFSLYIRDTSFITLQNVTPIVNTISYRLPVTCTDIKPCNTVVVEGPTAICGLGTQTYIGRRTNGCTLPVNWEITGGTIAKTRLNDSTVRIDYLQTGSYLLIGRLGGGCETLADTLSITVSGNSQVLDIGPSDSLLCLGNTIALNAGTGFLSYVWQDGSTLPTYKVTSPGQYYVRVGSVCGTSYSDTININLAPPVNISIGPDRNKCNNDTIQLNAPSGFLNYTWGNNYNINSLQGQSVIVNPLLDTLYFVKAEKTPGCFGYDSVRVYVRYSSPISFGADTSICANESLTLNAGVFFTNYLWNTGAASNQLTVTMPGVYSIVATAVNGCKSYDTLQLKAVHALPVVSLNKNTGLCKGENRILYAGQHSNYLWNDGSTNASFVANTIGTYYVQVRDLYGCTGSDTSIIIRINELPANFLPSSQEICNYGSNTIQPINDFENYSWSSGSRSKTISVFAAGIYRLQVVDRNGCIGADTIVITQKQCFTGLFVPTAFTPNADGLNDNLKAMLFGDIQSFNFKIINRYGNLVFASNNPAKGWDGTISGLSQDSGVYIWVCVYSLAGKPEKLEKGTFVLMR